MLKLPRVVPWCSHQEWIYVYTCLYSSCKEEQHQGVNRVKAWRSRGKVPHSVDATASFIEIQLSKNSSKTHLQMLYSTAFIRFVNGIVDAAQKSQYAQSITHLADNLGLPSWFVDLRHAATHDALPTLQILQAGSLSVYFKCLRC